MTNAKTGFLPGLVLAFSLAATGCATKPPEIRPGDCMAEQEKTYLFIFKTKFTEYVPDCEVARFRHGLFQIAQGTKSPQDRDVLLALAAIQKILSAPKEQSDAMMAEIQTVFGVSEDVIREAHNRHIAGSRGLGVCEMNLDIDPKKKGAATVTIGACKEEQQPPTAPQQPSAAP